MLARRKDGLRKRRIHAIAIEVTEQIGEEKSNDSEHGDDVEHGDGGEHGGGNGHGDGSDHGGGGSNYRDDESSESSYVHSTDSSGIQSLSLIL